MMDQRGNDVGPVSGDHAKDCTCMLCERDRFRAANSHHGDTCQCQPCCVKREAAKKCTQRHDDYAEACNGNPRHDCPVTHPCSREDGHPGPCNGLPRHICLIVREEPGREFATETEETEALLSARGKTHGNYESQSYISDGFRRLMEGTPNWKHLQPCQRDALFMVTVKIARILNGDPDTVDHWADMAGYSRLVADILERKQS